MQHDDRSGIAAPGTPNSVRRAQPNGVGGTLKVGSDLPARTALRWMTASVERAYDIRPSMNVAGSEAEMVRPLC
jgi:hypothetical protein